MTKTCTACCEPVVLCLSPTPDQYNPNYEGIDRFRDQPDALSSCAPIVAERHESNQAGKINQIQALTYPCQPGRWRSLGTGPYGLTSTVPDHRKVGEV